MPKVPLIILIILNIFTIITNAKPVRTTSFEDASKNAPIIVIATLVKYQYESILDGETISVDEEALWKEYKVMSILKNDIHIKTLKTNDIIRIPDKSNGCIRHETNVTRMGKILKLTHRPIQFTHVPKSILISELKKQRTTNNKYILFLKPYTFDNTYDFLHYGWSSSPSRYSQDKENIIQKFLEGNISVK